MQIEWRKSSFSGAVGNCVEMAFGDFRKSSFSGAGNDCIELAFGTGGGDEDGGIESDKNLMVGIRDTKHRNAGTLVLPDAARASLTAFARTIG